MVVGRSYVIFPTVKRWKMETVQKHFQKDSVGGMTNIKLQNKKNETTHNLNILTKHIDTRWEIL